MLMRRISYFLIITLVLFLASSAFAEEAPTVTADGIPAIAEGKKALARENA